MLHDLHDVPTVLAHYKQLVSQLKHVSVVVLR
jgi:hypothetical protein